eukprot:SAG11_NODE_6493_length_1303_cov_1.672757_1_plen_363_part_01
MPTMPAALHVQPLLLLLLLLPVVSSSSSSSADLTVVNSLGPVRNKETVVSFVPNFVPSALQLSADDTTSTQAPTVKLCTAAHAAAGRCRELPTMQHAAGVVHWELDAPTDQYNYSLCLGGGCGPLAQLNHAELMWHQCVGSLGMKSAAAGNGLRCAPGSVLRLFGTGLAFNGSRCAAYSPYVHGAGQQQQQEQSSSLRLTPERLRTAAPIQLASATASCYEATFMLPASLAPGSYTLEVKSNLPGATWQLARDPDQRKLAIAEPLATTQQCDSDSKIFSASSAASLKRALASAAASTGGATVVVKGTIALGNVDTLTVPNCTVLQGVRVTAATSSTSGRLRWVAHGGALGVDCGFKNSFLIGV